jgi:hypothetical protein
MLRDLELFCFGVDNPSVRFHQWEFAMSKWLLKGKNVIDTRLVLENSDYIQLQLASRKSHDSFQIATRSWLRSGFRHMCFYLSEN